MDDSKKTQILILLMIVFIASLTVLTMTERLNQASGERSFKSLKVESKKILSSVKEEGIKTRKEVVLNRDEILKNRETIYQAEQAIKSASRKYMFMNIAFTLGSMLIIILFMMFVFAMMRK